MLWGRGLEYYDMPAVRHIAANAAGNDYRFSTLILGIVESRPFPGCAGPPFRTS